MVHWTEGEKVIKKHKPLLYKRTSLIFYSIFAVFTATLLILANGCAPLPPLEEESVKQEEAPVAQTSDMDEQLRKQEIRKYSSFAYERWKNGEYEVARGHFNKVRELDIEHKENIYRKWADCFVRSDMLDSALFAYQEGIKYFPDDDYLHNSLAIMYRNTGNYEDAIAEQQEALRIKPDNEDYLFALAEMYEKIDEWAKTVEIYEKLAALFPDNQLYNQRVIDIKRMYFDPEEYLESLKQAVEKFPDDPKRRYDYASVLLEQGHSKKAEQELVHYTNKVPDNPDGWRNLARARENLANFNGAIKARKKAVDLEPESLRDIIAVGRNYLNLNSWSEARNWAQRALNKDGNYASAWVLMADIYFNCADKASGDNPKYNDKLVFAIAYGLYKKAAASDNIEAQRDGERGMRILSGSELIPSTEERFMNRDKSRPSGKAYEWIDQRWSEVSYIDQYLKTLE